MIKIKQTAVIYFGTLIELITIVLFAKKLYLICAFQKPGPRDILSAILADRKHGKD